MQAEFRLVNGHQRRQPLLRLQKQSRKRHESERAVRNLVRAKFVFSVADSLPTEHHIIPPIFVGFQDEVFKDRKNQMDRFDYAMVAIRALFTQ